MSLQWATNDAYSVKLLGLTFFFHIKLLFLDIFLQLNSGICVCLLLLTVPVNKYGLPGRPPPIVRLLPDIEMNDTKLSHVFLVARKLLEPKHHFNPCPFKNFQAKARFRNHVHWVVIQLVSLV